MGTPRKMNYALKKRKQRRDHQDLEEFMEDQSLEDRLGIFETKPDSELFVVDTAGNSAVANTRVSARLRKRLKLAETPKCFQVPTTKVKDPNAKRNIVKPVGSKPTALSKLSDRRRSEKQTDLKKVQDARNNRKRALQKKKLHYKKVFNIDIWGEDLPEAKGTPSTLCDDFISPEAQHHNVLPEKRLREKPPLSNTVVTRAAMEVPHPGTSYNPGFEDHQDLLQTVAVMEKHFIKIKNMLNRSTTGKFGRVTLEEKEAQWREEMSSGLIPKQELITVSSESETEYKAINPPVKNKKKDHKARRKQRERIEEKERLKRLKIDKQKITDINKIRQVRVAISNTEQKQAEQRLKRVTRRATEAATASPALNAHKVSPKEPDFVEPDKLTGDLRQFAPDLNLIRDRYNALIRRGELAASKLMMKKKRKVKSYYKPGHKVTDEDISKYYTQSLAKNKLTN